MTEPAPSGRIDSSEPSLRLDRWLWHARFFRTRAVSARVIEKGEVRVNSRRVTKPATQIRIGDGVSFAQGAIVRVVRVRGLGPRRGPAPEAQSLYVDLV